MSTNLSPEVLATQLVNESDRELVVEGPLPVVEPSTSTLGSLTGRQEPVVSRRELWSYYRECGTRFSGTVSEKNEQYTTMVTTYASQFNSLLNSD